MKTEAIRLLIEVVVMGVVMLAAATADNAHICVDPATALLVVALLLREWRSAKAIAKHVEKDSEK